MKSHFYHYLYMRLLVRNSMGILSGARIRTLFTSSEQNSTKNPLLLMAFALLAFAGNAIAADKPNFSGEWKMNVAKSDFGLQPAPTLFIRRIEHTEPHITIVEEQTGGMAQNSTRSTSTDGEVITVDMSGAPVDLSAIWDGNSILATTSIDSVGVTYMDLMTLSDDGRTLTSKITIESGFGDTDIRVVFELQ